MINSHDLPSSYGEFLNLQNNLVMRMTTSVKNKIAQAGYLPEEIVTAYILDQVIAEDDIDTRLNTEYRCTLTNRILPRIYFLEFNADGTEVIDVLVVKRLLQ